MIARTRPLTWPLVTDREEGRTGWTPLGVVLAALPLVALTELALVRVFYRVGMFVPKQEPFRGIYRALTGIGSFALNLASVLTVLALGMVVALAARRGRRTVAAVVGTYLVLSLADVVVRAHGVAPIVRASFALTVVVVAFPSLRGPAPPLERLAVAAVVVAFLLSAYAGLAGDAVALAPTGPAPEGGTVAQLAGEVVATAAAFLLFAAWARRDGLRVGPVLAGLAAALGLVAGWQANGAITGILALWTAGFRLFLPPWVYVAALWAFGAATGGWVRPRPWRAGGLVLLLAGGLLPGSTYQQALLVLALLQITDGVALGGLPAGPAGRSTLDSSRSGADNVAGRGRGKGES